MLCGFRIAVLLLAAIAANLAPACGRTFKHGAPERDAALSRSATGGCPAHPAPAGLSRYRARDFFRQTSQVTWPISSSSKGYPASFSASLICPWW